MPVTINGTTGVVTPGATIGSINGILKSSSGAVSQAVAGQDYGQITLATAQTASGTSVDFTGIPSWAKRITVMFSGVSTNGTSIIQVQLGDSGGFETSGYTGSAVIIASGVNPLTTLLSSGFLVYDNSGSAVNTLSGSATLFKVAGTSWIINGMFGESFMSTISGVAGTKSLSDTLTQVRITTVNGTDTFDAGTINISYE
jgi:hypothetical protein